MNGKTIGDIGETRVLYEFTRLGISVFLPYGENTKKDIIAEFNNKLNRIQVKTVSLLQENDTYQVHLSNTSMRSGGKHVISLPTKEDIDYYAIYCLEREKPILIPISLVEGQRAVVIRYGEYITTASIYEQDFYFEKVTQCPDVLSLVREEYKTSLKDKVEKAKIKTNKCVDCGRPISHGAFRCRSCASVYRNNQENIGPENRITREELKNLIKTESFLSIGKMYEVSDNAIRKWCDFYNLPRTKTEILGYSQEEWNNL